MRLQVIVGCALLLWALPALGEPDTEPDWLVAQRRAQKDIVEGLTLRLGDSVDQVRKALDSTLVPEPVVLPGIPKPPPFLAHDTQIQFKTRGLVVTFREQRVIAIRIEPPFRGGLQGLHLGDPEENVEKLLGPPAKTSTVGTLLHTMTYYFDDVTTTIVSTQNGQVASFTLLK
jgi:hypothetical protein